jgi:signal transduction histidine kinase
VAHRVSEDCGNSDETLSCSSFQAFCPVLRILLDVMMPDIDGMQVCQQIKTMPQWQAVPIVMVTALTSKEDLAKCIALGADDFISKPVNSLELRARVRSMLRIKQQYDSIQTLSQCQENSIQLLKTTLSGLRGNIARALPHELNTPLNGISGTISLLTEAFETMSINEVQALLQLAQQSSLRMEQVIQKFLTYVQLELSAVEKTSLKMLGTTVENVPVQDLIEQVAQKQAKAANRLQDLVCDLEPANVVIKPEDLECILTEVLDNAFKFSKVGTPVKVMSKALGATLCLSISNQGRGMTTEQVTAVGAFMQFDRQIHEQQGLGLGLAIASKITKMYGGFFSIQNDTKGELTIYITFPARAV